MSQFGVLKDTRRSKFLWVERGLAMWLGGHVDGQVPHGKEASCLKSVLISSRLIPVRTHGFEVGY